MNNVYVKLRMRERQNKYRKMLSTDETVFPALGDLVESATNYVPGALLEEGEWFKIEEASQQEYAIDAISGNWATVDFDLLTKADFQKIDFLFVKTGTTTYFQNITKAKLATKKAFCFLGEEYRYQNDSQAIVINDWPDAVHCLETDTLYFRKLEPIIGIFKGIEELFREATDEETERFLQNEFIVLKNNYGAVNVKRTNRKRIALAMKTLSELSPQDRSEIFNYIGEYCPCLKTEGASFSIGNEEELKLVLFGIEQRFYTTLVGGEKRIANSVIQMNS